MLLSIIIINYNTFELTCNCIRSIKSTTTIEHEIILVDNNSKECDSNKFLDLFPDIRLLTLDENIGFGRANNLATKKAKGKYFLLLNSDTIVKQNTIKETVNYLEENPCVDILGCKVMFDEQTVQTTVVKDEQEFKFIKALKYLIKRNTFFVHLRLFIQNRKAKKDNQPSNITSNKTAVEAVGETKKDVLVNYYNGNKIGSLIGVFILLKRSVFIESKGFDPDFFLYYEETEWFINRLRKYNIVYYPYASILHFHGGSNVHNTMNLQFYASSFLFWYKMGYAQFFAYFFFTLFEIPSRFLVRVFFNRPRPGKDIPSIIKSLPYAFKVLRHSNNYGARHSMLKLARLKKNNL